MADERSRPVPEPDEQPTTPEATVGGTGEPVVTDAPSSHQPAATPPAGSEPQGRTTTIAAIAAIIVVVVLIALLYFL